MLRLQNRVMAAGNPADFDAALGQALPAAPWVGVAQHGLAADAEEGHAAIEGRGAIAARRAHERFEDLPVMLGHV